MRRLDAGEGEAALLAIVAPALKHYEIMRGPLRVEWRKFAHQIPEMAVLFGKQIEAKEDGIWLTPEWSPEAEAARASQFEAIRHKSDQMRGQIAKERCEAALQVERQANQLVDALQMKPLFE